MSHDLATKNATGTLVVRNMDDLARLGQMLAKSGYFKDAADAAQAGVKVLAGLEMGIGAFSAMSGIHIIEGKPSIGAGLMAAAVKRHPKYDYRVRKHTAEECEIEFFEAGESVGVSSFTIEDAKQAGLQFKTFKGNPTPWAKNPRNMLFARALSNGVRWYCPDVFDVSTYTPEELGADVDDEGNVIDVPSRPERPAAPALSASEPQVAEPEPGDPQEAPQAEPAPVEGGGVTVKQLSALAAAVKKQGLTPDQTRAFLSWVLERPIASARDLTKSEASRVIGWTDGQWAEALADYATAAAGGPPEDEPDLGDLEPVPAGEMPAFDPSGKAERKPRRGASA